jgi:hypothetical protein
MYVKPYLIQRAKYRDSEIKVPTVGACFDFDYMGAAEFETGALGRRLLELSLNRTLSILKIDGVKVWVIFNPDYFNLNGVEYVLNQLRHGKLRTKEWHNFDVPVTDLGRSAQLSFSTDTWFEIQGGLCWTIDPNAGKCLEKAILGSAKAIMVKREERNTKDKRRQHPPSIPPMHEPESELRKRLIAEGHLIPASK